ncbi:hypothetical protein IWX90DRAFT_99773 [Phyllosticta citrichinensis]|uniref:Uncharacterized protein n=1 Tax=Phyllosticta citrichinensis TaxID=1130410 RepID=A0ABR1Y1U1_9PEZI
MLGENNACGSGRNGGGSEWPWALGSSRRELPMSQIRQLEWGLGVEGSLDVGRWQPTDSFGFFWVCVVDLFGVDDAECVWWWCSTLRRKRSGIFGQDDAKWRRERGESVREAKIQKAEDLTWWCAGNAVVKDPQPPGPASPSLGCAGARAHSVNTVEPQQRARVRPSANPKPWRRSSQRLLTHRLLRVHQASVNGAFWSSNSCIAIAAQCHWCPACDSPLQSRMQSKANVAATQPRQAG